MGFPLTTCLPYREISARFLIWIKTAVPKSDIVLRSFSGEDPIPIRVGFGYVAKYHPASASWPIPNPTYKECFSERYTINRLFNNSTLDDIDVRTRPLPADDGFGIRTEIDVQATMKKKLGVETPPYRILGACNPKMAHQVEPRVGAMLPCNVILREVDGGVEVSAIDLVASMQAIKKSRAACGRRSGSRSPEEGSRGYLKTDVEHHRKPDDFWAGLEMAKWGAFNHPTRLGRPPARLKFISSDIALWVDWAKQFNHFR
ncbi:MAG: hypothetical protein ACI8W8_004252 [Rhodothermales bacterium]|jgi:hypothetical protein